jgi:hypothetical protein
MEPKIHTHKLLDAEELTLAAHHGNIVQDSRTGVHYPPEETSASMPPGRTGGFFIVRDRFVCHTSEKKRLQG